MDVLSSSLSQQDAVILTAAFARNTWLAAYEDGWLEYDPSVQTVGAHAVLVVAILAASDERQRALVFKNSWGSKWGDNGYGYMPEDYLLAHGWVAHALSRSTN